MNQVSNKADSKFVFSKTLKMILVNNRPTIHSVEPLVEEAVTVESVRDDSDYGGSQKAYSGEEPHESLTT